VLDCMAALAQTPAGIALLAAAAPRLRTHSHTIVNSRA
jgi:hypothetical protein